LFAGCDNCWPRLRMALTSRNHRFSTFPFRHPCFPLRKGRRAKIPRSLRRFSSALSTAPHDHKIPTEIASALTGAAPVELIVPPTQSAVCARTARRRGQTKSRTRRKREEGALIGNEGRRRTRKQQRFAPYVVKGRGKPRVRASAIGNFSNTIRRRRFLIPHFAFMTLPHLFVFPCLAVSPPTKRSPAERILHPRGLAKTVLCPDPGIRHG